MKATKYPPTLHRVWAITFDIVPQDTTTQSFPENIITSINERLVYLRQALHRGAASLVEKGVGAEKFQSGFEKALAGCALGEDRDWNTVSGVLTHDTVNVVDLCADILGTDEREIRSEDLTEVLRLLAELEEEIAKADLPSDVKSFFFAQIAMLRRAIREYPTRGPEGIKRALYIALGEQADVAPAAAVAKGSPGESFMFRLHQLMQKLNTFTTFAQNVDKAVGAGASNFDRVMDALRGAKGLISGG
jgi:hypothetical protein